MRDQKVESPLPGGLPIVPLPGTIFSISLPNAAQVGQEGPSPLACHSSPHQQPALSSLCL